MNPLNVCCRNVKIIAEYVEKTIGSSVLLYPELGYSKDYLEDENNWIPLATFTKIMERAIDFLKDDQAPYKMGLSAQKLGSWGAFKYLQKIFGGVVMGPIEIFQFVGKYNEYFNKTKTLSIIPLTNCSAYAKIKFSADINPLDDRLSEPFIQGILAGVTEIWHLPPAEVKPLLREYNIKSLLIRVGGIDSSRLTARDGKLLLDNQIIAEPVILTTEKINGVPVYTGGYRQIEKDSRWQEAAIGIRVVKNLKINKQLTLNVGEIYNAPYFIYQLTWQSITFWQKIYRLLFYSPLSKKAFREGLENQLSVIKNYVGTLEQKVLERTEQLNQAKNEAEYWRDKADQLVRTQLPEAIAQQMMTSKLQAEKIHGTIIFTDLANFTDFSRHLDPAEVNKHLIEHFTEMSKIITAHGGWVNKFLGDGILALFGLDDRDTYTTKAIAAAIEMQEKMADLPHLKMRVGVATGDFITGEFGTEELRRFDCLGHTVNLASRLQGFAEIGEILVCEDTKQAAADHFTFSEPKKITPKGIGEITIYTIKN